MFDIKDGILLKKGRRFQIKGINLGGWLNREGYIIGGRNLSDHVIWKKVTQAAGKKTALELIDILEKNFITPKDFRRIKDFGFLKKFMCGLHVETRTVAF